MNLFMDTNVVMDMLVFRTPFAREIRERMRRIQSGKLSEKDLEEIRKHKQILKGILNPQPRKNW